MCECARECVSECSRGCVCVKPLHKLLVVKSSYKVVGSIDSGYVPCVILE